MPGKVARLYSKVKIKGSIKGTFQIVTPEEVDIFKRKISSESPLGKALLTHKIKEVIKVKTPKGISKLQILAID